MERKERGFYAPLWIPEVDFLRGFAISAVIIQHTSIHFTEIKQFGSLAAVNILIFVSAQFAVPLFILLSGFVLSRKCYNDFSLASFYKRRAGSVVPQYLTFSVAYTVFFALLNRSPLRLSDVLVNIVTTKGATHLWFFAIIIQLYVLYPLLIALYRKCDATKKVRLLLVVALAVQTGFNIFVLMARQWSGISSLHMVFLSHIFYFVAGIHLGRTFDAAKTCLAGVNMQKMVALSVLLILFAASWYVAGLLAYGDIFAMDKAYFIAPRIVEPFLFLSLFVILFRSAAHFEEKKGIMGTGFYQLGSKSFGIYLVNVFFIVALTHIMRSLLNITSGDWIFYPSLFWGTLFLSFGIVSLLRYVPFSGMIIGRLASRQ